MFKSLTNALQMERADIFVNIEGGETASQAPGLRRFQPGETIRGTVEITPASDIACKKLLLRLKWRTEGRGDRDEITITEVNAFEGTLPAGIVKTLGFSFFLPNEPWSYAGHYINIVWGIEVELDVPWAANPKQCSPFILAPAWAGKEDR